MTQTLSGTEVVIAQRKCESGDRADDQISKFLLLAAVSRHCLLRLSKVSVWRTNIKINLHKWLTVVCKDVNWRKTEKNTSSSRSENVRPSRRRKSGKSFSNQFSYCQHTTTTGWNPISMRLHLWSIIPHTGLSALPAISLRWEEILGLPQDMIAGWAWLTWGSWVNHLGLLRHSNHPPQSPSTLLPGSSNYYSAQAEAE